MPAKKRMIRAGKVVKRLPPKKGFKIVGNKYLKILGAEKIKLKKAAIKGAKKKRGQSAKISRARKISLRIRKARGIKENSETLEFTVFQEWKDAVLEVDAGADIQGDEEYAEAYSEGEDEAFADWHGDVGFVYDVEPTEPKEEA